MNKRKQTQRLLEFFLDGACIIFANIISFAVFRYLYVKIQQYPIEEWLRYGIIVLVSYAVGFFAFHTSMDIQIRNRTREFSALLKNALFIYLLFGALIVLLKNPIVESRWMIVSSFVLTVVFTTIARYALKRFLTGSYSKSKAASMVGIITISERAEEFTKKLNEDWSINVRGIALLDDFCTDGSFKYSSMLEELNSPSYSVSVKERTHYPDSIDDVPVISTDSRFMNWMRSSPLDDVYINLPYGDDLEIQEIIEELEDMGITVHINIPTLDDILDESKFNNINCKMQYGYPMASFAAAEPDVPSLFIKRAVDILLGLLGCIMSIPIIAITAIPLKAESPGPLIFKQKRVGKNGRTFNIYKLRSMYIDAEERKAELIKQNKMEGYMFKMDNDPRITKVGRFIRKYSIDELPQFFNVVKGDMSLVGTRPPTVDEFREYESRHKRRLSMRPGITGMWQVSGRSDIQSFEEVVELDCRYIDEFSLWLDFKILLKTVGVVLTHKGAE